MRFTADNFWKIELLAVYFLFLCRTKQITCLFFKTVVEPQDDLVLSFFQRKKDLFGTECTTVWVQMFQNGTAVKIDFYTCLLYTSDAADE